MAAARRQITYEVLAQGIDRLTGQLTNLNRLFEQGQAAARNLTGAQERAAGAGARVNRMSAQQQQNLRGVSETTNNTSRAFAKMAKGMEGSLVPAYATVAANAFALTAAFNKLREAAALNVMFEAMAVTTGRTGIAMQGLVRDMQSITKNAVSMEAAAKQASIAVSAGFDAKTVQDLTLAASNASKALGVDMTNAMDRVFKGAIKAEPELLDELGIILRLDPAARKYASSIGKSVDELSTFEKQTSIVNEVLEQAENKFGALADLDSNPYDRIAASLSEIVKSGLNLINSFLGPLAGFLADNKELLVGIFALVAINITKLAIPAIANFSDMLGQSLDRSRLNLERFRNEVSSLAELQMGGSTTARALNEYSNALVQTGARSAATARYFTPADISNLAQHYTRQLNTALREATEQGLEFTLIEALGRQFTPEQFQRELINPLQEAFNEMNADAIVNIDQIGRTQLGGLGNLISNFGGTLSEAYTGFLGGIKVGYEGITEENIELLDYLDSLEGTLTGLATTVGQTFGALGKILSVAIKAAPFLLLFYELLPVFGKLTDAVGLTSASFDKLEASSAKAGAQVEELIEGLTVYRSNLSDSAKFANFALILEQQEANVQALNSQIQTLNDLMPQLQTGIEGAGYVARKGLWTPDAIENVQEYGEKLVNLLKILDIPPPKKLTEGLELLQDPATWEDGRKALSEAVIDLKTDLNDLGNEVDKLKALMTGPDSVNQAYKDFSESLEKDLAQDNPLGKYFNELNDYLENLTDSLNSGDVKQGILSLQQVSGNLYDELKSRVPELDDIISATENFTQANMATVEAISGLGGLLDGLVSSYDEQKEASIGLANSQYGVADASAMVTARLQANATMFEKLGAPLEEVVPALTEIIASYLEMEERDPTKLVQDLSRKIEELNPNLSNTEELISTLVVGVSNWRGEISLLLNDLSKLLSNTKALEGLADLDFTTQSGQQVANMFRQRLSAGLNSSGEVGRVSEISLATLDLAVQTDVLANAEEDVKDAFEESGAASEEFKFKLNELRAAYVSFHIQQQLLEEGLVGEAAALRAVELQQIYVVAARANEEQILNELNEKSSKRKDSLTLEESLIRKVIKANFDLISSSQALITEEQAIINNASEYLGLLDERADKDFIVRKAITEATLASGDATAAETAKMREQLEVLEEVRKLHLDIELQKEIKSRKTTIELLKQQSEIYDKFSEDYEIELEIFEEITELRKKGLLDLENSAEAQAEIVRAVREEAQVRKLIDLKEERVELEKQLELKRQSLVLSEKELAIREGTAGFQQGTPQYQQAAMEAAKIYDLELEEQVIDSTIANFEGMFGEITDSWFDAFDGLFDGTLDGFDSFLDTMKNSFKKTIAQMAAQALAKPILMPIMQAVGGMFGMSPQASGGMLQNILMGKGGTFYGMNNLGGAPQQGGMGGFDMSSLGSVYQALSGGISGLTGGIAQLSSSIGSLVTGTGAFTSGSITAYSGAALSGAAPGVAGVAGATTTASVGTGTALAGAMQGIAAVAPYIAAVLFVISLIAGNKKPPNKAAWGNVDLESGDLFGTGTGTGSKAAEKETLEARDGFLNAIGAFSQALEELGADRLTGSIGVDIGERDGIQVDFGVGEGPESLGTDVEAALAQVFDRLIDRAEGLEQPLKDLLDTFSGTATEMLEFIGSLLGIKEAVKSIDLLLAEVSGDSVRIINATMEDLRTNTRETYSDFMEAIAGDDPTEVFESFEALRAAAQQRYDTEIQLVTALAQKIQQLKALVESIQIELANRITELTGIPSRLPEQIYGRNIMDLYQEYRNPETSDERRLAILNEGLALADAYLQAATARITAEYQQQIDLINAQIEATQKQIDVLNDQKEVIQDQIDALNEEREERQKIYEETLEGLEEQLRLAELWVGVLESAEALIKSMQLTSISPQTAFNRFEMLQQETEKKLQEAFGESTDEDRAASANEAIALLQQQLADLQGLYDRSSPEYVMEYNRILSQINDLRDLAAMGADDAKTLEEQIEDLKNEHSAYLDSIDAQIEVLNDQIAGIDDQIEALNDNISAMQDQIAALDVNTNAELVALRERAAAYYEAALLEAQRLEANVVDTLQAQLMELTDGKDIQLWLAEKQAQAVFWLEQIQALLQGWLNRDINDRNVDIPDPVAEQEERDRERQRIEDEERERQRLRGERGGEGGDGPGGGGSGHGAGSGGNGGFATGLDFVPRDNFLARLHRGERVLTAREARNQNSITFNPTINIEVAGNANAQDIANAVRRVLIEQIPTIKKEMRYS